MIHLFPLPWTRAFIPMAASFATAMMISLEGTVCSVLFECEFLLKFTASLWLWMGNTLNTH